MLCMQPLDCIARTSKSGTSKTSADLDNDTQISISSSITLGSLIDALAARGEKTALLALAKNGGSVWSYRQLADRIRLFANGLARAGFKRGDPIAILAENRPEWIAAALGVIRAGATIAPLDVQISEHDLAHVLNDSHARAIITTAQRVGRLAKCTFEKERRVILVENVGRGSGPVGKYRGPLLLGIAHAAISSKTHFSRCESATRSRNRFAGVAESYA